MEFRHINSETNGYIKAIENETQLGIITYYWEDDKTIVVDHTEVNPLFEGNGVGSLLVNEILRFVDQNSLNIVPLCPFVKVVMHRLNRF
ncbi:MAG TPA: GNAT family N-acetyltransferase [Bacteroidales bacterium]|nr:GNAT family N-acetyltransferase [Bacteroidales bacterium]HPS71195.1 GNAT family N-acetyltransferase [Bacteroidales bacterium]